VERVQRRIFIQLVLGLLGLLVPASSALAQPERPFLVIVNPQNPTTSVDRKFVANAFLKKATRWSNDSAIRPVDLAPRFQVRRRFSQDVLKRSVEAVKSYWQRLVFSGRGLPPPELDSDDAVVAYVARHPGAIGYVSVGVNLSGVKVLEVR
jgi:ABC-type phosphate transport system substrate-binding protein